MRTPTAGPSARAATHVAAPLPAVLALALLAAACDGTTSALGPPPHPPSEVAATTGSGVTVGGQTSGALVGRWTRIDGAPPGVLLETTFTFLTGGSGTRTVVTRTEFGTVLAVDRQAFTWTAGGGVVLLRFPGPVGETLLRASFAVDVGLSGTTLQLNGVPYRRAGA